MMQGQSITTLLRKNIRNIKPYASARTEFSGNAGVFLDANEHYRSYLEGEMNRYPDPLQRELVDAVAAYKGVEPQQVFISNGSDEVIDLIYRAFAEPGDDNALIMPPTYGVYQVFADLNNVETIRVPLQEDFSLDVEGLSILFDHRDFVHTLKILFICSPNNPTGNAMDSDDIKSLVHSFPGIVVVDEAYQDFSDSASALKLIKEYQNLVVLQTFSKAWGMAGARVGMAFADPSIIKVLHSIKYPYNVSRLSQQAALQALSRSKEVEQGIAEIKESRDALAGELSALPYVEHVYPSDANFLLVRVTDAPKLYDLLKEQGIIIRNRHSEYHCAGCVRITVGSPEEQRRLLEVMKQITL